MYLVTGATGNVGSEVVRQLLALGKSVRVFTRDPGKVAHWGDRVQVATGDFQRPETLAAAMTGAEAAFLVFGAYDLQALARQLAAARALSHPRIAFLSTLLADRPDSAIGQLHQAVENVIRTSGLRGKFVRPGGFMSNTYQWIGSIRGAGLVYNPTGTGKFAPIAPEDIAAVAVECLVNPDLPGERFDLTGGELINTPQQVEILAGVLGRPLRCVDVPVETAVQNLIRTGIPAQVAAAVGQSYQAIRDGRGTNVSDAVRTVTGQMPKTFAAWARDHASRFL